MAQGTSTTLDPNDPIVLGANPLVGLNRRHVAAALGRFLQRVAVEPGVATAKTLEAAADMVRIVIGRTDVELPARDKRFADPTWRENPLYRRLLQAYLVQTKAVMDILEEVELDDKSRERARFALTLLTEAMAPTNTLLGNPTALAKAVETRGSSLTTGMRHALYDLRNNGGMPSTVAGLDTDVESQIGMLASTAAIEAARSRSQRKGVLDGEELSRVFAWLRPNDLVWGYVVNNYLLGQNPPAFDILYWNADTTCLPAQLHSDFLDLHETNGLVNGTQTVLGETVDLTKVTGDAYVVAGITDHIVPWQTAYRTSQILGGDSRFVLGSGGHIQALVNPITNERAKFFTRDDTPGTPDVWFDGAEAHSGSWWPHWTDWLNEHSGATKPAPKTQGSRTYEPMEDAPGRYVHL